MTLKKISVSISSSSAKRIDEILSKCRYYRDDVNILFEEAIDSIYKSLSSKNFKR